jgi:hypothetical protein
LPFPTLSIKAAAVGSSLLPDQVADTLLLEYWTQLLTVNQST